MKVNELMDSKRYVRNGMEFMSAKDLVEPFMDVLAITNEEVIEVEFQNEVVNANADDSKNIAYPRFSLKANFGQSAILPGYNSTIGMIVALDQAKPIIKIYTGQEVASCLNLCIFNAKEIFTQDVLADRTPLLEKLMQFGEGKDAQAHAYAERHDYLMNTELIEPEINQMVGDLVRKGRTSVGINHITTGIKYLDDPKSIYSIDGDRTTLYNFYNAFTQAIGDGKDIMTKPQKTLALSDIILN